MLALLVPVTTTLKPFLAEGRPAPAEVEAMNQAWVKAVLLQVILWSHPYVRDGDFSRAARFRATPAACSGFGW